MLWLVPLGFAVGTYGTLVGAGGGFILMPVLLLMYPTQAPALLSGISLAVVCLNALSGSVAYAVQRRIDYRSGLLFALAATPGAILGAMTSSLIPRRIFDVIFGSLLVAASITLLLRPQSAGTASRYSSRRLVERSIEDRDGVVSRYAYPPLRAVILSFFVGFLSSLLGIGGGIIHVPILAFLLSFPIHVATATSHFVLAITALGGTVTHVVTGVFTQGLRRILLLGVGVMAGAQLGAFLSPRLKGRWILRGLSLALLLAGVRILVGPFLAAAPRV
jgi:hypothetical protein